MGNLFSKNDDYAVRAQTSLLKAYLVSNMNLYSQINLENIKKTYYESNSNLKNKKTLRRSAKIVENANNELKSKISSIDKERISSLVSRPIEIFKYLTSDTEDLNIIEEKIKSKETLNKSLKAKLKKLKLYLKEKQNAIKTNNEKILLLKGPDTRLNKHYSENQIINLHKNREHKDNLTLLSSRKHTEPPCYLVDRSINSDRSNSTQSLNSVLQNNKSEYNKYEKNLKLSNNFAQNNLNKVNTSLTPHKQELKSNKENINSIKIEIPKNKNLSYILEDYHIDQEKEMDRYFTIKNNLSSVIRLPDKHVLLHSRLGLKNKIKNSLKLAKEAMLRNLYSRKFTIYTLENKIEKIYEGRYCEYNQYNENLKILRILNKKIMIIGKEIEEYNHEKLFINKFNLSREYEAFYQKIYIRHEKSVLNEDIY